MRWTSLPLLALLAGCASNLPAPIREAPADNPALRAVRQAPEQFVGRRVRWGGTVAGVDNRADGTCLELVGRDLLSSGRPRQRDRSEGRFLACTDRFLDPLIYSQGRAVTVGGEISGVETRRVGDYPYRYPVVRADAVHLWEPEPESSRALDDDPFWYTPWPGYYPYPYPHPFYGYPPYWRPIR